MIVSLSHGDAATLPRVSGESPERPELTGTQKLSTIGTLVILICVIATIVNSVAGGPKLVIDLTTAGLVLGLAAVGLAAYLDRSKR